MRNGILSHGRTLALLTALLLLAALLLVSCQGGSETTETTPADTTVTTSDVADSAADSTVAPETNEAATNAPETGTSEAEDSETNPSETDASETEIPTEEITAPVTEPVTEPETNEPDEPKAPAVVHISQDEMYFGDAESNKINGTDVFAPGHYADFNGVVNYTQGTYAVLIDWGWVALNADEFQFGYLVNDGEIAANPDYTVAAGEDVKAVATQLGASNASRFKGVILVSWLPVGEHNIKFVVQIGEEIHTLREYTVIVTAKHEHSYDAAVTAPTCTEGGFTTYTCTCGDSYVADETPAAGHSFANGTCGICGEKDPNRVLTIAEALELCGEPGNITSDRYYVRGIVESVKNGQYGQMIIKDDTGSIEIYGMYSADGSIGYALFEYKPVKGDEVLVHCILQNYNGTKEIKNARLIEYVNNQGNIDVSQYADATVSDARTAEKGTLLKIKGVVARITYANGMKPSGFILVGDGSSIYVYDGDAAQRVQIGNTVEVAGTKDYWILDSEIDGASKFGYQGCNQLTNCILVSNDNGNTAFDTTWVQEITVKELMNIPVTEDVTTLTYKVNALVKKVPGNGFTNYYFFDIDGETGTYTYTQCNGNDFAWLDAFDGKICTVYITALNAKSTGTSCFFRFLPVDVIDEGYTFDTTKAPEYVLEYHIMDLFKTEYTGNPMMEVPTSVSSELLGFAGATVSYASSNESAVKFSEQDGKLIMECLSSGKATVTVTVTYGDHTATESVEITVDVPEDTNAGTVQDAINAELNAEVTVKGIVGPSLVNRDGFYLIDETGLISVIVADVTILGEIEPGQEIVIKGMRDKFHNNEGGTHAGQTAITKATVVANYYGQHEYDTSHFVTGKTVDDFYGLDASVDYSTTVFVLKATVVFNETAYYTNASLVDADGTKITLYCSSGKQYGFLKQFAGQEVTVELAACNWNNKKFWAGCVLAVHTEDGKIINTLNFDNN